MSVRFSADYGTPASIANIESHGAGTARPRSACVQGHGGLRGGTGAGVGAIFAAGMVFAIKNGSMLQLAAFNMDKQKTIDLAKLALARL